MKIRLNFGSVYVVVGQGKYVAGQIYDLEDSVAKPLLEKIENGVPRFVESSAASTAPVAFAPGSVKPPTAAPVTPTVSSSTVEVVEDPDDATPVAAEDRNAEVPEAAKTPNKKKKTSEKRPSRGGS